MRETEQIVARIMAESDKRSVEAEKLKNELLKARLAEKDAKEKLLEFLSQPALEYPVLPSSRVALTDRLEPHHHHLTVNGNSVLTPSTVSVGLLGWDVLQPSAVTATSVSPVRLSHNDLHDTVSERYENDILPPDMDPLTLEIEKERHEYLEKSKNLQEQLKELKAEIEDLKLEEKQTPYDLLHQEQVLSGENKYSTLRKVLDSKD